MNHRRAVSVLFAAAAATMLVTGSFGFTAVSADRGVSVAVVDSENAYVGATACQTGQGSGNGSNSVKVTVTNQFAASFTVDEIRWSDSAHESKDRLDTDVTLAPGESRTFTNAFGEQEVTVEVSGGLDATVTAPVVGPCAEQSTADTENETSTSSEPSTTTETTTTNGTDTPA